MFGLFQQFAFAETNALIEVKLFKTWVIPDELAFVNLSIKNTGTTPILLFEDAADFSAGQLATRRLGKFSYIGGDRTSGSYSMLAWDHPFFKLPSGETHVYVGRKFLLYPPFSREQFVVSVYLNNGFWLNSEPMTVNDVTPDSEEKLATINDGRNLDKPSDLVAVTYKNERWLYIRINPNSRYPGSIGNCVPICPISLTNKIRIEPHDGKRLHKIWDGDKSMIYEMGSSLILEGPDENDVFGKWTRERKQQAEADNAEVRRKKAEVP